ncbi:MAG TPA: nucleotidyltransferase family protein [Acidiferrobacteraceae bacterium]|nr:nucleotidyltransferase family protein [Acidiferrobacteraceae bacterium]
MDALILAAGRGERMQPLTDHTPKPLLEVGGRSLIEHLLLQLSREKIDRVIINTAHLGEQIVQKLGDGQSYGVSIRYSDESDGVLETGGGIVKALNQLRSDPFVVVNGDIWTDYPFQGLPNSINSLAHLILVNNPDHHSQGDFNLNNNRVNLSDANRGGTRFTYSGIGLYSRSLFKDCQQGAFPLAPLLRQAIKDGQVSGEYYSGQWWDIGTPERLRELDRQLRVESNKSSLHHRGHGGHREKDA